MKENTEDISHQDILNVIKTSNQEVMDTILDAINVYSTHADAKISNLESDVSSLKTYVEGVVNTQMVTKNYLDEKFFEQDGRLGISLRKEDDKVNTLTGVLLEKKVLTKSEAKKIAQTGPSFMKV